MSKKFASVGDIAEKEPSFTGVGRDLWAFTAEGNPNSGDLAESTYRPVAKVAAPGGTLKEAWDAVRAECDEKFKDLAIYGHCLPFNVARVFDEARGIETPRIWTAEGDAGIQHQG